MGRTLRFTSSSGKTHHPHPRRRRHLSSLFYRAPGGTAWHTTWCHGFQWIFIQRLYGMDLNGPIKRKGGFGPCASLGLTQAQIGRVASLWLENQFLLGRGNCQGLCSYTILETRHLSQLGLTIHLNQKIMQYPLYVNWWVDWGQRNSYQLKATFVRTQKGNIQSYISTNKTFAHWCKLNLFRFVGGTLLQPAFPQTTP